MLNPEKIIAHLCKSGVSFFTGVPDSLLKEFCACVTDTQPKNSHVIAANEGGAIGLAIGHHLSSRQIPLVYMQNSGLGNTINPILSLASNEVYAVPMLLMIGWRGEPNHKDEPQHIHQGRVMLGMLDAMDIPYIIISEKQETAITQLDEAIELAKCESGPVAIIIKKGIFEKYETQNNKNNFDITREEAIIASVGEIEKDGVIVSTTGMASRELFEYRKSQEDGHQRDFLTVGGMGHASQIALGIAIAQPNRVIYCFDGDGAAIMHMGSLPIIGQSNSRNFVHIVLNNGAHASVGGQPTVGFEIDFCQIAKASGYKSSQTVRALAEIIDAFQKIRCTDGPHFIEIKTLAGNRDNIGRPTSTPKQNKEDLMLYLQEA